MLVNSSYKNIFYEEILKENVVKIESDEIKPKFKVLRP